MSKATTEQEASTAVVTRSCLEEFQQCLQQLHGKDRIHIQTRLADLRLWADSVGAVAHAKASLDSRFKHRPNDILFIQNLLSMLEGFLKECIVAASCKADLRDIMTNIDSAVDSLAFLGVQIRRSGRKSRIRKADDSFDQNRDKYRKLRAHLACIISSKPAIEGRPTDEGKDIHSVDYFAKLKLSPIQERLVEANLRRRHRFQEAQRHSEGLKDRLAKVTPPVIPQQFITMAVIHHPKQDASPMQDKKIAAAMTQQSSRPAPKGKSPLTLPATSASGLDSRWGGLQNKRRPGSTMTRLTAITANARYPRARRLSNADQKLAKCPCCCQAIPAAELEGNRWRKHVANDMCPYTCVVENCPTPYNLFVTQEEWNDHIINDHPPHWQCPCCGGDPPIFNSISGITTHLMTEHSQEVGDDLGEFLLDTEINVIGITKCPLCDSEGPQDSLDLIDHVLHHIHDFSLRSLPWPADLPITLDKSPGVFDMNHAVKIVKDDEGNEFIFDIAGWAETMVPTFNRSRGVLVCYDSDEHDLDLGVSSSPGAPEGQVSLQLRDLDRNPPKTGEVASLQLGPSERDYFSQFGNDYFVDESSDGRFSQTSNSEADSTAASLDGSPQPGRQSPRGSLYEEDVAKLRRNAKHYAVVVREPSRRDVRDHRSSDYYR
ncbi:hypothetical protein GQ44DRAFT_751601 [Phaeosphaeriaceae sp. PMI808]|nr:hypothetical protein GQ44DRAFT_751601 [Phaeosphaeriaceae sp. PMI808]